MTRCIVAGLVLLGGSACAADLSIGGHFENTFLPQRLGGELVLLDTNRLRVNLASEVGPSVSFSGDCLFQTFHGARTMNALDYIPVAVVDAFAAEVQTPVATLRPLLEAEMTDGAILDNAHVTVYLGQALLRLGKQQLSRGAGYAWNPTDIFQPKNVLDPTYEKEGVNAGRLEVPFGTQGALCGTLSPGESWRVTAKEVRIEQHVAGFDLSGLLAEESGRLPSENWPDRGEPVRRRLVGGNLSGELLGWGVWAEGAYSRVAGAWESGQGIVGVDHTWRCGLYLMAEYYHNGQGDGRADAYSFSDWVRHVGAEGEDLGRDYVYAGQRYPLTELLDWSNYLIANLGDRSGVYTPWVSCTLNDDTEVSLAAYIPFGRSASEFGALSPSGLARVRVYF